MSSFNQDVIALISTILDRNDSTKDWLLINIERSLYKGDLENYYQFEKYPNITEVYTYLFKDSFEYLEKKGAVISFEEHRYTVGFEYYSEDDYGIYDTYNGYTDDSINNYLLKRKLLKKNQYVGYHYEIHTTGEVLYNPYSRYGGTALINTKKLIEILNELTGNNKSGQIPVFSEDVGELTFLNQTIKFKGEISIKSVKLLIDSLNGIVTKKDFFCIDSDEMTYFSYRRKGKIHNTLKKRFQEIKNKIHENKILQKALICVNQDGFGIFVNTKYTEDNLSPQ